jgi:hypothetical protein
MVAVTADLGFGDPSVLSYSAHAMVRPLCAEPATGSVRVILWRNLIFLLTGAVSLVGSHDSQMTSSGVSVMLVSLDGVL